MSHMVIHRSADGQPVYHQVESLEEAVRNVESLRNSGQGNDACIYRMHEVPIEVKTYYRVEVATAAAEAKPAAAVESTPPPAPPAAPVASTPAPAAAAPAAVKPEPAVAGAAANGGRFGLFGKS